MEPCSLGYRTDLLVRRLGGSDVVDGGDHVAVRTPAYPDFYWGNFVLVPTPVVPGDAGRCLALFSSSFPDASHVAIGIDGTDGEPGDVSDLLAIGMSIDVSTVLTASALREPTRTPIGLTCRLVTTDDDWDQALALRLAVAAADGRCGAEYRQFLEGRIDEARHIVGTGHAAYFGAFVDDGRMLSGLGLVVDASGLARFQDVETHPHGRRQGLASALVHAAGVHGFAHLGVRTLVIVADAGGPAIGLYRSLGFIDTEYQVGLLLQPLPTDG